MILAAPKRLTTAQSAAVRRAANAARSTVALVAMLWLAGMFAREAWGQSGLGQLFENVPGISSGAQPAAEQPNGNVPPAAPALSPPRIEGKLPLVGDNGVQDIDFSQNGNLISLKVRDKPLSLVIPVLAQAAGMNTVASNDIDAIISITLNDVPIEEALTAVLEVANYTWVRRNNIILITSLTASSNLPAGIQGRQIQVFELDFAAASVVSESIAGFLSPVGKSSISKVTSGNNRLTRELVVVEDVPSVLARVAAYIAFVDQPPRQVLLEAHIFSVNLKDTTAHGINLSELLRVSGSNINLKSTGLASASASPAFLATVDGGNFGTVIECLQSTTDTKTLGSPRLLVLNGQEAMFHVGDDIGYQGSQTTTETSTFQNVQFLEVGVVLRITPQIARDGRVLLHVEPEVSSGQINPTTSVPDKSTTELKTDVMLYNGQGMIIGGLIKENDSIIQSKIPYLGNVRGLGWFFRRSTVIKERSEIIIAVLPRVQPYDAEWQAFEQGDLVRAGVPLWHGPLHRNARPWDPVLPDGRRVSVPLIPRKPGVCADDTSTAAAPTYVIPPYPLPRQRLYGDACDPTELLPLPPSTNAFLSNEAVTVPVIRDQGRQQGAFISDQP
ncbi:MAG: secretin and TonB N-terminal domain-containing protein [Pirellulales bacterium]